MRDRFTVLLFASFLLAAVAAIAAAAYLQGREPETPAVASAAAPTPSGLGVVEPSPTPTPVPPTATPTPDPPATLALAVPGLPDSLDPLETRNASGQILAGLVFSGLTRATSDGRIVPDLAASWRVDTSGTVWDFVLRSDARWQDGTPVTPADVVFTVGRAKGAWLGSMWQGISAEQSGGATVRFRAQRERAASVAALASLPLLPAHVLAADAQTAARFQRLPVGAGPFKVAAIDALGATLERVAPRAPGGGNVQSVRLLFTGGESEDLPLVRSGVADVALLPVRDAAAAATTPGVVVWRVPRLAETMLLLNTGSPPFADDRVRRAISLALDRESLVDAALGGLGIPSDSPAPGMQTPQPVATRDVPRASALLEEAGWRLGADGGRRRVAGGPPLAIAVLTTPDPSRLAVAQNVAVQLRVVAVNVTVQQVGTEGLVRDFLARGRFDAAVVGVASGLPSQLPMEWWRAPSGTPAPENFSGLADAVLEAAAATSEAEPDATARAVDLARFRARFDGALPAIPLYQPVWLLVASPRITAAPWGNDATPGDLVRDVADWRVAPR